MKFGKDSLKCLCDFFLLGSGGITLDFGKADLKNDSNFLSVLNVASLVDGVRLGHKMNMGLRGWGVDRLD